MVHQTHDFFHYAQDPGEPGVCLLNEVGERRGLLVVPSEVFEVFAHRLVVAHGREVAEYVADLL